MYNESHILMTDEKGGKEVSVKEVGCKTRSSWFNRSGQCWGCQGEKFVKDVMETRICEYGFILKYINHSYYTYKEVIGLKIVCGRVDHAVDNQL